MSSGCRINDRLCMIFFNDKTSLICCIHTNFIIQIYVHITLKESKSHTKIIKQLEILINKKNES